MPAPRIGAATGFPNIGPSPAVRYPEVAGIPIPTGSPGFSNNINFEIGLEDLADQFQAFAEAFALAVAHFHPFFVEEMHRLALPDIQRISPVDTGRLRFSWRSEYLPGQGISLVAVWYAVVVHNGRFKDQVKDVIRRVTPKAKRIAAQRVQDLLGEIGNG